MQGTMGHKHCCMQVWMTYHLILAITRDQFAAAVNDVYYAVLDNPFEASTGSICIRWSCTS